MKNRLIELLRKADDATEILTGDFPSYEEELKVFYTGIANYLLDNGVIVLPCAVGDTLYWISDAPDGEMLYKPIEKVEVCDFSYNGHSIQMFFADKGFKEFPILPVVAIGKELFLTKEEAEAKLKELEE